jgi:hypothetical protein
MGRHTDSSGGLTNPRRIAQVCGLVGGVAWLVTLFLAGGGTPAHALLWVGVVLLTVALLELGLLLVKSDVLLLRVFVALALPTLVWGVLGLILGSTSDRAAVEAAFGTAVALISGVQLLRRRPALRETL